MKKFLFIAIASLALAACSSNQVKENETTEPVVTEKTCIKDYCTEFQHVGIPTTDIEATIAFYQGLGFDLTWRKNEEGGPNVAFLSMYNTVIETYQKPTSAQVAGAVDHFCIDCTDIDNLFTLVKESGYTLVTESVNQIAFLENGVKYFKILGPNQEIIEFCEKL